VFFIVALMRRLRLLAAYIALVFLGGALLAPWLHWLTRAVAGGFAGVAAIPFRRYVDRAILGLALMGLWPLVRRLDFLSRKDWRRLPSTRQWQLFAGGFFLGLASLGLVAALAFAAGKQQFRQPLPLWIVMWKLPGIALTAGVVAVMEEVLFRGVLFGALRRDFHWALALAAASLVYAGTHFLDSHTSLNQPVTWSSGLRQLAWMLRGFAHVQAVIPAFINLTLAGVLLGLAYQRSGDLFCAIGLHGGWVFLLKLDGVVAKVTPGNTPAQWGPSGLADGWLALPVLAATALVLTWWPVERKSELPYEPLGAA
jgi:membrane protease YdiL (CAAX protease family)